MQQMDTLDEMVSVIVPVYNVEAYLPRCVESILEQTYDRVEIILVDDGSLDRSGAICEDYEKRDPRIKVIHKRNGGLSDARNAGIEISTGSYLMFVDSDDWIREDCVALLVAAMQYGQTQISACAYLKTKEYKCDAVGNGINIPDGIEIWPIEEAYRHLFLNRGIDHSAWAKMFRRVLFEELRFPFGKMYEDQFVTYKLFHMAQKVSYIGEKLYYYFDRPGSIQNESFTERKMDELEAALECEKFIEANYPQLREEVTCRLLSSCFHMLFAIDDQGKWEKEIRLLTHLIRKNRRKMVLGKHVNRKVRLGCLCSYFGFRTAQVIYLKSGVRGKINI